VAKRHGVTDFLAVFEGIATTFFDLETDLLVMLDEAGNISRVNPAFERALGYRELDMLGVAMIRLVDVNDWAVFIRAFSAFETQPFRLLCSGEGEISVRLIAARFRAGRGYLVLRKTET
jgi:PAS domain-containing protein